MERKQRVLVIHHGADRFGGRSFANTRKALEYARLEHETHDLLVFPAPLDFGRFSAVLTCTENLFDLGDAGAEALIGFVENGGGLGVIYRGMHPMLYNLFGIVSPECRPAFVGSDFEEQGMVFPGRALPAFSGLSLESFDVASHSSFDVWPTHDVEIVSTTTSAAPVAWRNCVGKGRVLFWNTSLLGEKRARGLIIETLQCVQSVSVQPLANVGVVQVDDFPAPLDNTLHGFVAQQHPTLSGLEFYCTVWYPDMLALARKHRLELSFFCTFDYTNRTEAPFVPWRAPDTNTGQGNPNADSFAAVAKQRPAELGLHGFNHLSLVGADWPDCEAMHASLLAALDAWKQADLGPSPVSYVPPNNEYDAQGILTLSKAIPGIQTISGYYLGVPEDRGGNREFGSEPWNPNLFCLPRATFGHEALPNTVFDAVSQIAAFGTWTHFLHADDVLDTPGGHGPNARHRNPKDLGWRDEENRPGLYGELDRLIHLVRGRFPWLRFMTTAAAASEVKQFLSSQWSARFDEDQIHVAGQIGGYFKLRLNGTPRPRLASCTGGTVVHQDTAIDYSVYLIKQDAAEVAIKTTTKTRREAIYTRLRQLVSVGGDASRDDPQL